jgi:hypothetical protein
LSHRLRTYRDHAARQRTTVGTEETDKYNILLEYGELDLDELFAAQLPPVLQREIQEFWIALFDVAKAVDGIHNLKQHSSGTTLEYHG